MAYLNLDLDYFSHPKVTRLVGLVGVEHVAIPIKLWCYVGKFHCEDGLLASYSAGEVEAAVGWAGESGKLVAALLKVEFLEETDEGYLVHDWLEHGGHLAAFKKRSKKANTIRWKDLKESVGGTRSARLAKARKKGTHTKGEWEGLKKLFDHTCVRCLTADYAVEKDHIVPLYLNGSDGIENLQPVCAKCNASKTGDTKDYRLTYLISKGKASDLEQAKGLLEGLLDALQMPPPNHPNQPSDPNQPSQPVSLVSRLSKRAQRLEALEAFQLTQELQDWAKREFSITIPDDVLREFKNYWREKKALHVDWEATFKNRIRQLVGWGVLKPSKQDVWAAL